MQSDASAPGPACTADGSAGALSIPLGSYSQCTGSANTISATEAESAGGNATGTITLTESNGHLSMLRWETGCSPSKRARIALQPTSIADGYRDGGRALIDYPRRRWVARQQRPPAGVLANGRQPALDSPSSAGDAGSWHQAFIECPLPSSPIPGPQRRHQRSAARPLCEDTDAEFVAFAGALYPAQCDCLSGTDWPRPCPGRRRLDRDAERLERLLDARPQPRARREQRRNVALITSGQSVLIQEIRLWPRAGLAQNPNGLDPAISGFKPRSPNLAR